MTFTEKFKSLCNKTIAIDIDGTICSEERTFERPLALPINGAKEALQLLKENQNTIILWTARGWEQFRITERWLRDNGMVYDQLLMGKPMVDLFIDDRARQFSNWSEVDI